MKVYFFHINREKGLDLTEILILSLIINLSRITNLALSLGHGVGMVLVFVLVLVLVMIFSGLNFGLGHGLWSLS